MSILSFFTAWLKRRRKAAVPVAKKPRRGTIALPSERERSTIMLQVTGKKAKKKPNP